eukprot:337333-Prorocentrum_minimum.AAC.10
MSMLFVCGRVYSARYSWSGRNTLLRLLSRNWFKARNHVNYPKARTAGSMTVSQERYLASGPGDASVSKDLWTVPLRANGLPDSFSTKSASFAIPANGGLKINQGQTGFYRTVYDKK